MTDTIFDECHLLEELQQGNIEAFNKLYSHYAPLLYARLLRLLKNHESVEEILQEVFIKIWERRKLIETNRGFKTFIYRIADNLAIDLFRKISRDKALQMELWASSISFYLHTDEKYHEEEQVEILKEAINALPPRRKEILLLCKLEDKSYKEVADLLGISVSTISNQLVSATKDIKDYIVKNYKNDYLVAFIISFILESS